MESTTVWGCSTKLACCLSPTLAALPTDKVKPQIHSFIGLVLYTPSGVSVSLMPLNYWEFKKNVFSIFLDLRCTSYNRKKRSDDIGKNNFAVFRQGSFLKCATVLLLCVLCAPTKPQVWIIFHHRVSWEFTKNNLFFAGDDMNSYVDVEDIVSRTAFPKSWFWRSVVLPPCPRSDPYWWDSRDAQPFGSILGIIIPTCKTFLFTSSKTTSAIVNHPLQDSITDWEITGISLSQTHGEVIVELQCCLFQQHSCRLTFRHLCGWSTGGHCQKRVLHWPQSTILRNSWTTAGNKGRPPQLHPWPHHRESTLFRPCLKHIIHFGVIYSWLLAN